jgi:AcrR family transcriptional regulator
MTRSASQSTSVAGHRFVHPGDSVSVQPGTTQRERLVEAMLDLSARSGYHQVSIARLSTYAGVSSATFYAQFRGKEDCMLAAYRTAAWRILAPMATLADEHDWLLRDDWQVTAREGLEMLLSAVQANPHAARVLFVEGLAGGPRLVDESKAVLAEFEQRTQRLLDQMPPESRTLDLPVAALVGAVRHIVSRHLRIQAEDRLPSLVPDLVTWVEAYATSTADGCWSTGEGALLADRVARQLSPASGAPMRRPMRLPRGRHGLPAGIVARSHRTRIISATAEVMMQKGYANATVADIVAAAGVARDVFYEHFTDKQHAFLEAQSHPTQFILDTCAEAYFEGKDWAERVWNYLHTLIRLITENPAISHLRLVECYAAGPAAIRRAEEITRSFTIFLEEGYGWTPQARKKPRLCMHAITGAIYEVIQRHVARGEADQLPKRLPQLVYIMLAPFTGAPQAIELVEQLRARSIN